MDAVGTAVSVPLYRSTKMPRRRETHDRDASSGITDGQDLEFPGQAPRAARQRRRIITTKELLLLQALATVAQACRCRWEVGHHPGVLKRTVTQTSPGSWAVSDHPTAGSWRAGADLCLVFAEQHGTQDLLIKLALGHTKLPVRGSERQAAQAKDSQSAARSLHLQSAEEDQHEVPIDSRQVDLLLRAAGHPKIAIGQFAGGVRVGPGARILRLPALYKRKRKWWLNEQADSLDEDTGGDCVWRRNNCAVAELSDKVTAFLDDRTDRGKVLTSVSKTGYCFSGRTPPGQSERHSHSQNFV